MLKGKSPLLVLRPFAPLFPVSPKIFGHVRFISIPKQLDPKAVKCIFVGYPSTLKGYKCYLPPGKKWKPMC